MTTGGGGHGVGFAIGGLLLGEDWRSEGGGVSFVKAHARGVADRPRAGRGGGFSLRGPRPRGTLPGTHYRYF